MTEGDYAFVSALVRRRSGLSLGPEKRYLVDSRLAPLGRAAGFADLGSLVRALRGRPDEALVASVVDALATHETFFFRDRPVFDALRDVVLPDLAATAAARSGRRLRIWSAAASTGQEAYSVAMVAAELLGERWSAAVDILASDMVPAIVERARAGLYTQADVQRGLPIRCLLRHFDQEGLAWRVADPIRAAIQWRVANLLGDLQPLGRFDLILCRNLLIYLDGPLKADVLDRLSRSLAPGGVLCLGSAETTVGLSRAWQPHPTARGFFVPAGERRPGLAVGAA